ncbi:DUF5671 domain-containing protein [Caldilinea sp.]|jgi:hypothetical protein|uniref:DUF5671 domain-containing protein n=1 Tax=Caldilinea sp. TaxID=2293560 RepID=UPI001B1B3AFB|nr:DUF5671 domain-containing protein [Caldilinea sp.]MBO9394479.1 hypothetical protein [Caldilinea sp.]
MQNNIKTSRLAAVRRLYVYWVAFVSQIAMLIGINELVGVIGRAWLEREAAMGDVFFRTAAAGSISVLVVATPIFLVHWGVAQHFRNESSERSSLWRKLFLYASTAAALIILLSNSGRLLSEICWLAFGGTVAATEIWPVGWLQWSFMAAIGAGLVYQWHTVLNADGDFGKEARPAYWVRQLFLCIAGLIGLGIAIWGAHAGLQIGLQIVVDRIFWASDSNWWQRPLSGGVSQVLIGSWLTHAIWRQWQDAVELNPAEGRSVMRRIYLYLSVLIGAITALTPAALLLREGVLMVIGEGAGSLAVLLDRMTGPVSFIPVGAVIWSWSWTTLRKETDTYGDSKESATVRRVYTYLVTATGLALLWVGAVELLHALIDAALVGDVWREPLANGIALLAVGVPTWTIFWRRAQSIAERNDATGAVERNSWPRRLYLYGVALVGALVLLFTLAQVVYRILLAVMGESDAMLSSGELAYRLADSVVAGLLWALHLFALRADGRFDRPAEAAVGMVQNPDERRAALEAHIAWLEAELAAARAELAKLESRS